MAGIKSKFDSFRQQRPRRTDWLVHLINRQALVQTCRCPARNGLQIDMGFTGVHTHFGSTLNFIFTFNFSD